MALDLEPVTATPPLDLEPVDAPAPTNLDLEPIEQNPQSSTPFTDRAIAFLGGAGIPTSLEGLKEAGKFLIRSPVQDVKDIAADVAKIPERVRNLGQTLRGSPAATVARAPLSTEAFGVYGTTAGMLAPGLLKDKLTRGGEVTDASQVTGAEGVSQPDVRTQVGEEAPLRQQGKTPEAQQKETVAPEPFLVDQDGNVVTEGGGEDAIQRSKESGQGQRGKTGPDQEKDESGILGISQARTEAELGPGSVEPGAGAEMGSGFRYGQRYINQGGDPRLPIRRALSSGMVGKNDVGIVHAELDRLRVQRNAAANALEANPDDITLQKNFERADNAQRAWRKELQPVLTKASDALREAYHGTTPDIDPGTYQGLADLMDEHFKGAREITPEMRTSMASAARGVREARSIANREMYDVEQKLTKQLKGRKVMTPEQLDSDLRSLLEDQFKDCAL